MWVNPFWFGFLLGIILTIVIVTAIGRSISKLEEQEKEEHFNKFLKALESGNANVQTITVEDKPDDKPDSRRD